MVEGIRITNSYRRKSTAGYAWRMIWGLSSVHHQCSKQESRAVARKSRDAAAVLFGLNFADNIHYKFK